VQAVFGGLFEEEGLSEESVQDGLDGHPADEDVVIVEGDVNDAVGGPVAEIAVNLKGVNLA